jgi:hypothetical protein
MNPASNSRSGGRDPKAGSQPDSKTRKQTPNSDMQADDAGTAKSGNGGRGPAAEGAMKQTSKTVAETGPRR